MKLSVEGLDEFAAKIENLSSKARAINRQGLAQGAAVVADSLSSAISALPTESRDYWTPATNPRNGVTNRERQGLQSALGISTFEESSGATRTSVGFTGYLETYSGEVPAGMFAQCVDQGNSFRKATHTLSRALSSSKKAAQAAIKETISSRTEEVLNL